MKRLIILFSVIALASAAMAQTLTKNEINSNAHFFATQMKHTQQVTLKQVVLPDFAKLCIFNIEEGGFVIASSDSRTRPILAYSPSGAINPADLPDNLRYWLSEYENQIAQLGSTTLEELYQAYNESPAAAPKDVLPDSVAPLLQTAWNQSRYGYNSLVPYDPVIAADTNMSHLAGHPTVGCAALAMAQIMRYWEFPVHGQGSHSYSHEGEYNCWRYGTVSADFANATYDYDNMPFQLSDSSTPAQVTAVATLTSHCGVACNMSYNSDCAGSSGAQLNTCIAGMQQFFHYSPDAMVTMKNYYSNSNWINMLKQDLAAGRPVFYCGQSYADENEGTLSGGHAFVFDGYDEDDCFHVNWGWNGSCNGFYSVTVLRPLTQYDFTSYQYCAFNLHPSYDPMPILTMGSDLVLDGRVFDINAPVSGSYSITNIGDTVGSLFFGVNIYDDNGLYHGCVDGCRFTIQPGDTVTHTFSFNPNLPVGTYTALMQYSTDTFYAGITDDRTMYHADLSHTYQVPFTVRDLSHRQLSNLVLYAQFHDATDAYRSFYNLGYLLNHEVANAISPMFYGNIGFNHIFATQYDGSQYGNVVPFIDPNPRSYYQQYHPTYFPDGDTTAYPTCGPSQREMEFITHLASYIDTHHQVYANDNLDNDEDGEIDHLTIVITGTNLFSSHEGMFATHTSRWPNGATPLSINGKRIGTYSIIDAGENDITTRDMTALLCHGLGLPDLSHRDTLTLVDPAEKQSILSHGENGVSAIFKYKYLGLCDAPTQITADGTFLVQNSDSYPQNNLYYIKSAIDSNQWYLIEYRRFAPHSPDNGIYISRWIDTVPLGLCYGGNAHADGVNTFNTYWVFRPGSSNDSDNGYPDQANFTSASGRNTFGPNSDPHPYLADGTPERSFEIYDILDAEITSLFSVRFLDPADDTTAAIGHPQAPAQPVATPNPTVRYVTISNLPAGTPVDIYNMMGQCLRRTIYDGRPIDLADLPVGIYLLSTPTSQLKLMKM